MALTFLACPSGFGFHTSPSDGDSLTGNFNTTHTSPTGGDELMGNSGTSPTHVNLRLTISDRHPADLQVYRKDNTYFVTWTWFKPSAYALEAMTAMAVARRRIHFVLYFHANPGVSTTDPTADGMILDDYSFSEDGAC